MPIISSSQGKDKLKKVCNKIEQCVPLYNGLRDTVDLPEFRGERLTWELFKDIVRARELGEGYSQIIDFIEHYKDNTSAMVDKFRKEVLETRLKSASKANVLLSTVHQAKGGEWDHVALCDDFAPLTKFKVENGGTFVGKVARPGCVPPPPPQPCPPQTHSRYIPNCSFHVHGLPHDAS